MKNGEIEKICCPDAGVRRDKTAFQAHFVAPNKRVHAMVSGAIQLG